MKAGVWVDRSYLEGMVTGRIPVSFDEVFFFFVITLKPGVE